MPNGAIRNDEWLCTRGKTESVENSPRRRRNSTERTEMGKTEELHRDKPKSPTPSASGESTKMTNNDTRRKITPLEEGTKTARELGDEDTLQAIEKKLQDEKMEHGDARPIGAQPDSATAIAAKKMQSWKRTRK